MIDAKLVAMTITFGVIAAVAMQYVRTQSLERAAAGLTQEAGSQYDAPFPDQVAFVCNHLGESQMGCLTSFCDDFNSGAVDSDTVFKHTCMDGTERAVSFNDIAASSDWLVRGLSDSQCPAHAGEEACTKFDAASGGAAITGKACDMSVPYMASAIAVEHWRYVNRVHLAAFTDAFEAVCADPAMATGCDSARLGFVPTPSNEKFAVACPDDRGTAVFSLIDLLGELDEIVLDGGGDAEVMALLYGKCTTDADGDDVFDFNDNSNLDKRYKMPDPAPAEDPQTDDPDGQCLVDAGCNGSSCDDIDFAACAAASGCEGAAAMCVPDDDDDDDDRRLAVDTDTMFDFLDEETVESTETKKPRSLGELLKKEHGAAKAKNILELRASLHERKVETGADSRELSSWMHYGGRRRRWGAYWHHHHNPHNHNPHNHICKSQTEVDRGGCDDVCLGCRNENGNQCFGRCGPGCSEWNACGHDGQHSHRACWWHDSFCTKGMTNSECAALGTNGFVALFGNAAPSGTCPNNGGDCDGGDCRHDSGGVMGLAPSAPAKAVHGWGKPEGHCYTSWWGGVGCGGAHILATCNVCTRVNWGANDVNRVDMGTTSYSGVGGCSASTGKVKCSTNGQDCDWCGPM